MVARRLSGELTLPGFSSAAGATKDIDYQCLSEKGFCRRSAAIVKRSPGDTQIAARAKR
jgi:hypothetical protein